MRKSRRAGGHPPFVLLRDVLPDLAARLKKDLRAELASQADSIRIYEYCRCGTACGTFYCVPSEEFETLKRHGSDEGCVTVAKGKITRIETLDPSVHEVLASLFPAR